MFAGITKHQKPIITYQSDQTVLFGVIYDAELRRY
jgi:hypothetical protein